MPLVQHLEIADRALAKRAERRHRAAIGHCLAYFDLGRGHTTHLGRVCGERPGRKRDDASHANAESNAHLPLPDSFFVSMPVVERDKRSMCGRTVTKTCHA